MKRSMGAKWFETGEGKAWLEDRGLDKDFEAAPERECKEDDPDRDRV